MTVTDANNDRPWSSYVDTYDQNGNRVSQVMTFDDGRTVETSFSSGRVLTKTVH